MILGQQLILTSYPFGKVLFHVYLAPAALACIGLHLAVPSASIDVERSFSIYKTILADNHQSLKMENMKMLFIFNLNAASGGL